MTIPQDRYLVNIGQASIAPDGKARIHKLTSHQPANCQLEKIKDSKVVDSKVQAVDLCRQLGIDYKFCDHCC